MVGKQRTLHAGDGMLHRQGVCETTPNQIFKCKVDRDQNKSIAQFAITFAAFLGTKFILWLFFILIITFCKFLQELKSEKVVKCSRLNVPPNLCSCVCHFKYCSHLHSVSVPSSNALSNVTNICQMFVFSVSLLRGRRVFNRVFSFGIYF